MSTPIFSFTENPFENGTDGSYKKMFIISADTDSKLFGAQSNPLINPLFLFFSPFKASYVLKFTTWKSKEAAYKGKTTAFYKLLADLSGDKIDDFDVRIRVVYKRGTAQYEALLPNFRVPFQSGEIEMRIEALLTLAENIGADPALAAVKTDILAFHTLLTNTRNEQQALEGQVNTASAELELERINCARAMYSVLGGLMQVFNTNTSQISDFFDLETLRGHVADIVDLLFAGPIGGGQIVNVLNPSVEQYVPGVTLRIKNTTPGSSLSGFYFYTADSPTDGWNGNGQHISPGQEITVTIVAAQFRAYFNVHNQGATLQSYEVEIVEA